MYFQVTATSQEKNRRFRRPYDPVDLLKAYASVKEESMSVRKASIPYSVPLTTLRSRVTGEYDINCSKPV